MQFKNTIYDNYERHHTRTLYGHETLADVRRVFPVWQYHFGELLPANKRAAILDIGCGKGGFVWFLQQSDYEQAAGIDISSQQIEYGRLMGIPNIQCADARLFLEQQKENYDCIIARDVMEHFDRQEIFDILLAVRAALKPGGCFIMQSPNGEGIFYSGILYGDFTHEIAFTESSLHQIFRNTGFSEIKCRSAGPVPKGVISTLRWFLWQLIVLKTRFYKAVETGSGSGIFTRNLIAKALRD